MKDDRSQPKAWILNLFMFILTMWLLVVSTGHASPSTLDWAVVIASLAIVYQVVRIIQNFKSSD